MFVILGIGVLATLIGLLMLLFPRQITALEQRLNSEHANEAIPGVWRNRMTTRMRLAGALFVICGPLIVLAAFVGANK